MTVLICGRFVVSPGMRELMSRTLSPENECVSDFGMEICLTIEEPTTITEGVGRWRGVTFWLVGSVRGLCVRLKKG